MRAKKWEMLAEDGHGLDVVAIEVGVKGLERPVVLLSCYRHQEYDPLLAVEALRGLLTHDRNMVVGGDLNIHTRIFGAKRDRRGGEALRHLIEEATEGGGGCLNSGHPTWVGHVGELRERHHSHIDGTFYVVNKEEHFVCEGWSTDGQGNSDHMRIVFTVKAGDTQQQPKANPSEPTDKAQVQMYHVRRKNVTTANLAKFTEVTEGLAEGMTGQSIEEVAIAIRIVGEKLDMIRRWKGPKEGMGKKWEYGWSPECDEGEGVGEEGSERGPG